MYAVLEWDACAPVEELARVIATDQTKENAEILLEIAPCYYHREIITMAELEEMRQLNQ